jgi:acyl-CoA synthetase (AMP-forming)/AMP-acid ligase II
MSMNSQNKISHLAQLLSSEFAQRTAVVIPDTGPSLTYSELAQQVGLLREEMQIAGVAPFDVVILALPSGLEFLCAFLALNALNAVALPVNPQCKEEELHFAISDSSARFLVCQPGNEAARNAANQTGVKLAELGIELNVNLRLTFADRNAKFKIDADGTDLKDVAMIIYTSGTTSRPKSVPLTHANVIASLREFAAWFNLSPDDATLVVMPPFHVHGLIGATLSTLYTGGKVVLASRFSASAFWRDVVDYSVTWYTASPTIHQILLSRADKDHLPDARLRFIRSSSAKLPDAVRGQIEQRFSTVVLEAYGMTEAANQATANPLPPGKRKPGSVGLPAGVEIRIIDETGARLPAGQSGEICIKGTNVMAGYRRNEEANAKAFLDGWFRTGDLGQLDDDGYLHVSGRLKDLINRGGEKISPSEIEAALLTHPSIAEAVCFAIPDEKYGEEVGCAVVLKNQVELSDVRTFLSGRMAAFKIPKALHVVPDLPRTATNKIQRSLVAAMFSNKGV